MNRTLCVAPMMGCTDRHCRYLFRQLSPGAGLYSEMITASALRHGDHERLLAHVGDEPVAMQLGGGDPEDLTAAAKMAEAAGYQEVNLNCGCPSDRVKQGGIGACLMAKPALVADCFSAMAEAVSVPVTIKSRIGIDDHDDYNFFRTFIARQYDAGCRHFQIHARKAILTGLSPKENREIPPLNYDHVRRIRDDFAEAEFVINGGITSVEESRLLLKEFDGVMLGRAPYSNPYLLAELDSAIFNRPAVSRADTVALYRAYMVQQISAGVHIKHMAKHLLGLFAGIPGARAFRRHLSTHMYADDAGISVMDDACALIKYPEIDAA